MYGIFIVILKYIGVVSGVNIGIYSIHMECLGRAYFDPLKPQLIDTCASIRGHLGHVWMGAMLRDVAELKGCKQTHGHRKENKKSVLNLRG